MQVPQRKQIISHRLALKFLIWVFIWGTGLPSGQGLQKCPISKCSFSCQKSVSCVLLGITLNTQGSRTVHIRSGADLF